MSEQQKKPAAFAHVDGGLSEQLKGNLVNPDAPMFERLASGIMLLGARGVLERMHADSVALPGTAPATPPLQTALPKPAPLATTEE